MRWLSHFARTDVLAMLGIFVLAFALRVWGIDNGLPYAQLGEESPDITDSLNLAQGESPRYAYHRVGWPVAQIPLHGLHYVIKRLGDSSYGFDAFEADYFLHREDFILSTRIYLAALASLAGVVVYQIGKRLTGKTVVGGLAGVLLAVHPYHSYLSHQALPDAFATLWVALNLLGVVMIAQKGSRVGYVLAGLGAAVGMLARLQVVLLVIVPLVIAHVIAWYRTAGRSTRYLLVQWLWAAGAFVLFTVLFNPLVILSPESVVDDIRFIFEDRYTGTESEPVSLDQFNPRINVEANIDLPFVVLRPYLAAISVLSMAVVVWRRNLAAGLVVLAAVLFVFSILPTKGPRITFFLPVVIPAVVVAAVGLYEIAQLHPGFRVVSVLVAVLLVGLSVREAVMIDTVLARDNTQVLAREYIDANIPADSALMSGNEQVYSVPLERDLASIQRLAQSRGSLSPKYEFLTEHPEQSRQPAFDLYGVENSGDIQSDADMLAFLVEHQIAYVIETSYCDGHPSYQNVSSQNFPLITDVVREELTLLYEVSPFKDGDCLQRVSTRTHLEKMRLDDWYRTGPIIRIYRVDVP